MPKLQEVVEALLVSIPERLKQNENRKTLGKCPTRSERVDCVASTRVVALGRLCAKGKKLPAEWVNEWITSSGRNAWHYVYPPELDSLLRRKEIAPDRRMNNGPPQTAFLLASGKCPKRWHHHHLYDGKDDGHPKNAVKPLHAAYHPLHFTQSAGIVAITAEAHHAYDTDSSLRSVLRQVTWLKFGYDPDKRFAMQPIRDDGFEEPCSSENVLSAAHQ
jgi:hypothetical protein